MGMAELEPGPELDALLATKVMGWSKDPDDSNSPYWHGSNLKVWRMRSWGPTLDEQEEAWSPSTSVADAMDDLLRKLEERFEWALESPTAQCKGYRFTLFGTGSDAGLVPPPGVGVADTAPHAICLAALKAVRTLDE